MAGVLYNIASGKLKQSRDEERRGLLNQGIRDSLGTAPGLFDQSNGLFPGEQPIPGLQTAGTGLLADPNSQENQLKFASSLFGLPGGKTFGEGLIKQSLGFGQRGDEQRAGFNQRDREQQAGFDFTGLENQKNRQQRALIEAAKLEQSNTPGDNNLGSIPAGFTRRPLAGGGFADIPNPGTKIYTEAQGKINALEQSIGAMDELMTSAKTGGDFFGKAAGKQGILYENAVALIGTAFDKGVLQKEEREQIAAKLTDPTGIGAFFVSDERMQAEYNEVLRILQRKLGTENQKYALWGLGSNLAATSPAQQRQLDFEVRQQQQADEFGLTITPQPIPRQ